jgi:hypothetical protein
MTMTMTMTMMKRVLAAANTYAHAVQAVPSVRCRGDDQGCTFEDMETVFH